MAEGDPVFIIDNRAEEGSEKVEEYLGKWCNFSECFDIATGYFEIGALRRMDGQWQKLDKIRILMGDETSKSSKGVILNAIKSRLDESFDKEKDENHFMAGIPAIMEAIRSGKIEIRVYTKHKFHAKLYITHPRKELGLDASFALVGSSNFTIPGISKNIEMNVRIDPQAQVRELRNWFEEFWEQGEDVSEDVFKTIERHAREYEPFLIYGRSLEEYFRGRDATVDAWHEDEREIAEGNKEFSQMWCKLDKYQKDGYQNLLKIAGTWGGALLCDGVGLGKTYVGLMLLEKLAGYDRKRVLLLSPKSVHEAVWDPELKDKLGHLYGDNLGNITALKHTDLNGLSEDRKEFIMNYFDAIIIDEGHHFRNRNSRYKILHELINNGTRRKQVYFLTATPINNGVADLYRMISLFTNENEGHFASIGIHNLKGHFMRMKRDLNKLMFDDEDLEGDIEAGLTKEEADQRLKTDKIVKTMIVQRSRNFVRESMKNSDRAIVFPHEVKPKGAYYDLHEVYGDLLKEFEKAFAKKDPLFKLSIYYPYDHLIVPKDEDDHDYQMNKGRLGAIARLIRVGFLKRFESSFESFRVSCHNLLLKNLKWLDMYGSIPGYEGKLEVWLEENSEYVSMARTLHPDIDDEDGDEDYLHDLPSGKLTDWAEEGEFNVEGIVKDAFADIDQIVNFLSKMTEISSETDDKISKLIELLNSDEMTSNRKVIIFSEFMTTARYIRDELVKRMPDTVIVEIDSKTAENRTSVVRRFSPYYNGSSSELLSCDCKGEIEGHDKKKCSKKEEEIQILISTDVLAEGLNLQDSLRLINYDIHWNPVRLMQRIGRIDRRLNLDYEDTIIADHPERESERRKLAYWNFLPPNQLDSLLGLFERVSGKYLNIAKILGIEGGYGLTEEQELGDLKDFNEMYMGKRTIEEELRLKYQDICREYPELRTNWKNMPTRTISGKRLDGRYAFFCYSIPGKRLIDGEAGDEEIWTLEDGESLWFLYDFEKHEIIEKIEDMLLINEKMECLPAEVRVMNIGEDELSQTKKKIEDHIFSTIMRDMKIPMGHDPVLQCWMSIG